MARTLTVGGIHAVTSALTHAPTDCLELWLRDRPEHGSTAQRSTIEQLAATAGLTVQRTAAATLDRLNGDPHHQGVVLRRRPPAGLAFDALLARCASEQTVPLLLILDGVQDPRNFGACLRVADGAGVDAVIVPRDNSAPLSDVAARAASGALDTVALVTVPNLARAMARLQSAAIWITGAADDADTVLYDVDFKGATALALGNEGSGLRRLTRRHCDHLVQIPMSGAMSSLNVSTAAAVCLFEARRQRLAPADAG